jgi:hypothetical protein
MSEPIRPSTILPGVRTPFTVTTEDGQTLVGEVNAPIDNPTSAILCCHPNPTGGGMMDGSDSVKAPFVEPVILCDVPEDSIAMTEETFGPTIAINRVKNMAEAIELSNATRYGLGASVWSKRRGKQIASQLHTGMVSINSVIAFAAVDSVPFGGVKDSGYGRIHGPEGLLEFTYPRTVVRARFQLPIAFTSFSRTAGNDKLIVAVTKFLKGRLS